MAKTYQTLADEVRGLLSASSEPLRLAAIFDQSSLAEKSTQVATTLNDLLKRGHIHRSGEPSRYEYVLTDVGRAFIAKAKRDPDIDLGAAETARPAAAKESSKPSAPATKPTEHALAARPAPSPRACADPVQQAIEEFVATTETTVIPRDASESRTRLAALVIAYWPAALDQMPPTLAKALDASLGSLRPGA